jgi:hypothetical protein
MKTTKSYEFDFQRLWKAQDCAFLSIRKLFCKHPDFIPVLSGRIWQTASPAI